MKQYPHSALLTIRAEPAYINGKRQPDKTATVSIVGRYDADGKTIKKNARGDEVVIVGSFYMHGNLRTDKTVVSISIPAFGINEPVFDIQSWQSHTVILIANSVR